MSFGFFAENSTSTSVQICGLIFERGRFMISPRQFKKNRFYFHCSAGFSSVIWFKIAKARQWEILVSSLKALSEAENFNVHAFVMMETHMHLLFSVDQLGEHIIMEKLHEQILSHSSLQGSGIQLLFEVPLYCEAILHLSQYRTTYKYIYQNPVEAGIVGRCEEYIYSTLHHLLCWQGFAQSPFCLDQMGLIQNPFGVLHWLNSPTKNGLLSKWNRANLNETPVSSFLDGSCKA